ncbi:MAG: CoA transferase, partial [Moorella sp. (in: Bacteria)]|nr:CoA transferase [Moorella sp. (in: firmicutes)]
WQGFCQAVGRPDLLPEQFGGSAVITRVQDIFASRTRDQWAEFFRDHDVCCEPVLSLEEAVRGPLVAARGMLVADQQGREFLRSPFNLSGSPLSPESPSPRLGQHTREMLLRLGLDGRRIDELADGGALGADPPLEEKK